LPLNVNSFPPLRCSNVRCVFWWTPDNSPSNNSAD